MIRPDPAYRGVIMVITIPAGVALAFALLRLILGAVLVVLAMRRGMSPSLRVGWSFAFRAEIAASEPTVLDNPPADAPVLG